MKKKCLFGFVLFLLTAFFLFIEGPLSFTQTGEQVKPVKTKDIKRGISSPSQAKMFAKGRVLSVTENELKIERIVKKDGKAFKEVMLFSLLNGTNVTKGEYVRVDYVNNGTGNVAVKVK